MLRNINQPFPRQPHPPGGAFVMIQRYNSPWKAKESVEGRNRKSFNNHNFLLSAIHWKDWLFLLFERTVFWLAGSSRKMPLIFLDHWIRFIAGRCVSFESVWGFLVWFFKSKFVSISREKLLKIQRYTEKHLPLNSSFLCKILKSFFNS